MIQKQIEGLVTGRDSRITRVGRVLIVCGLILSAAITSGFAASQAGSLDWNRQVALSTSVSGRVAKVLVTPGQQVNQNDILLRLVATEFDARIALARAKLASVQHVYREAKKELRRNEELFERTVISTHELELAKIAFTKASSDLRQAKANLVLARYYKAESVLRAPFDAVVLDVRVSKGAVIVSRLQVSPMILLAEKGVMKVKSRIGIKTLKTLVKGQAVKVLVDGKSFNGKITLLGFSPVNKEGRPMYDLHVVFKLPAGLVLRAGQNAIIQY